MHCMNFEKNLLRGGDRAWSQKFVYFIIEKLYILIVEIRISLCDKLFNETQFSVYYEIFIPKPWSMNLLVQKVLKSDY